MSSLDLNPFAAIVAIPLLIAIFALSAVWTGRDLHRRYTDRRTAARFAAGALAAPHGDYSVFTPEEDPETVLRVVHRYMPDVPLGSVAAIPTGFRAQYGDEDHQDYPTARDAAHAIAARHVEIQPIKNLERRLSQTNTDKLAEFRNNPRG